MLAPFVSIISPQGSCRHPVWISMSIQPHALWVHRMKLKWMWLSSEFQLYPCIQTVWLSLLRSVPFPFSLLPSPFTLRFRQIPPPTNSASNKSSLSQTYRKQLWCHVDLRGISKCLSLWFEACCLFHLHNVFLRVLMTYRESSDKVFDRQKCSRRVVWVWKKSGQFKIN